ncbi:Hypothetical predicted protein [Olea europaea subsp. europaea]|uniref:Uncharacterized protein n=1 Tax=Olea europaea subsp. europaea TaxID=158383 RepID=A0A8S0QGD5_OLEEU|nr:Hypothetical predicted protein [Olea europaea subsp. europaea]
MEIRSSMTFLSDFVTALISSMMDAILAKATEKSEAHSIGDVIDIEQNIDRKGKGKMDPVDEIEYLSFPPTPSFDLGVASTPIISNEVDAIIAGVVKDCAFMRTKYFISQTPYMRAKYFISNCIHLWVTNTLHIDLKMWHCAQITFHPYT